MTSVLQNWVQELPMMQQTVLLTAIRGPDGVEKYHPSKYLLRWFRRCVLLSAMDHRVIIMPYEDGGGSFTGPSIELPPGARHLGIQWQDKMDERVGEYLRAVDALPHHFQMHFMHAAEIVGYKHPGPETRQWWNRTYVRLVHDLHLWPETEEQLDQRLGDSREGWLARNDIATVT